MERPRTQSHNGRLIASQRLLLSRRSPGEAEAECWNMAARHFVGVVLLV